MIEILNIEIAKLYIDNTKQIFHFEIKSNKYNEEQFLILIDYFKNFWILANEASNKYYMLIDIKNIGYYPLDVYTKLVDMLRSLEEIFKKCLNSSCILIENKLAVNILKPILSVYKSIRPVTFINTYEEAIIFYSQPENSL